jgi:vacuolar-type H+-ATPase subunit I/STV1
MTPRPTNAELFEGVNALVEDPDASALYAALTEVADVNTHVVLTGRNSILNPLLELVRHDRDTDGDHFERVMQLVDRKRQEQGAHPLDVDNPARRAYMREFMAHRRERLTRVLDALNSMRAKADRIRGSDRADVEQRVISRWQKVKQDRERAQREHLGRRADIHERQAMLASFWQEVESEIAQLQAYAERQIRLPVGSQRPDDFKFPLQPKKD